MTELAVVHFYTGARHIPPKMQKRDLCVFERGRQN